MKNVFTIPRQALADLLQAAGSPLTPEQYAASLFDADAFRKYPKRAWVAAVSKYFLLIVAVAAVFSLPFLGFTPENMIIAVGLVAVTFFEYRVHSYFLENDPRAPGLGFRNQSLFAAAIVIYCLLHAFMPFQLPVEDQVLVEQNNVIDAGMLKSLVRLFYLFIAVVAGGSQFALACYYRGARRS